MKYVLSLNQIVCIYGPPSVGGKSPVCAYKRKLLNSIKTLRLNASFKYFVR